MKLQFNNLHNQLNKHLFNQNYGMAGALSVMIFIITGALSLLVFRALNAYRKKDK